MSLLLMEGFDLYGDQSYFPSSWIKNGDETIVTGRFSGSSAVQINNDYGLTIPIGTTITTRAFAAAAIQQTSSVETYSDWEVFGFFDGATVLNVGHSNTPAAALVNAPVNKWKIKDSAGNLWEITSSVPSNNTWFFFELAADVNSASANIVARVNGSEVLNVTGDTSTVGDVKRIGLGYGGKGDCQFDDLFVMDDAGTQLNGLIGDRRVVSDLPDALGDTNNFTANGDSSNELCVDDPNGPDDDTTYNASSAQGDVDLFGFPTLPSTISAVEAVEVVTVARKDDSTTREVAPNTKSGTTIYTGSALTLTSSYQRFGNIWENNPDTGSPWTPSEVDGAQFGYEVVT